MYNRNCSFWQQVLSYKYQYQYQLPSTVRLTNTDRQRTTDDFVFSKERHQAVGDGSFNNSIHCLHVAKVTNMSAAETTLCHRCIPSIIFDSTVLITKQQLLPLFSFLLLLVHAELTLETSRQAYEMVVRYAIRALEGDLIQQRRRNWGLGCSMNRVPSLLYKARIRQENYVQKLQNYRWLRLRSRSSWGAYSAPQGPKLRRGSLPPLQHPTPVVSPSGFELRPFGPRN